MLLSLGLSDLQIYLYAFAFPYAVAGVLELLVPQALFRPNIGAGVPHPDGWIDSCTIPKSSVGDNL